MSDFQERGWKQTAWSAVRDRCKRKTRSRRSSTSTWTRCCSPPRSPGLTSVIMVNMGHLVNTENYHKKLPKGQRRAFEWDPRLTTALMANFIQCQWLCDANHLLSLDLNDLLLIINTDQSFRSSEAETEKKVHERFHPETRMSYNLPILKQNIFW